MWRNQGKGSNGGGPQSRSNEATHLPTFGKFNVHSAAVNNAKNKWLHIIVMIVSTIESIHCLDV